MERMCHSLKESFYACTNIYKRNWALGHKEITFLTLWWYRLRGTTRTSWPRRLRIRSHWLHGPNWLLVPITFAIFQQPTTLTHAWRIFRRCCSHPPSTKRQYYFSDACVILKCAVVLLGIPTCERGSIWSLLAVSMSLELITLIDDVYIYVCCHFFWMPVIIKRKILPIK